jgi:hypothetical protein
MPPTPSNWPWRLLLIIALTVTCLGYTFVVLWLAK